jgi:phosphate acetyltransferase
VLCKLTDRKQILGGILDGALAFDNAMSARAASTKGIESPAAGCADVLFFPTSRLPTWFESPFATKAMQ